MGIYSGVLEDTIGYLEYKTVFVLKDIEIEEKVCKGR